MKILIIDDKAENLYMLETLLKGNGYGVISAVNGKEALKKLRSEGAGMIISDILMPVMDGFQLCQKVRADETLKHIPFIFYTATYTNEKDEEFALSLGANKFLRKPMEPDEFIRIIQGVIRDMEEGKLRPQEPVLRKREEIFEIYSQRLVKKLEKKMLDLEKEIDARERAEESVKHFNLVLRAIRKVGQLIIQEKDPDRLLQSVCDILIENRGYHNAWIALLDDTGRSVVMAEAGLGKDFLPIVERLKKGKMTDCAKMAQMQSEIVIIKDPLSTCTDCPLIKKYSGRSGFATRLEHNGKMYGLLTVSIPRDFATDEEEQSLFKEVAKDIAYALYNIDLEKDQKQAEKAIEEAKHREAEGRLARELVATAAIVNDMLHGEVDDAETERRVLDVCLSVTDSLYGIIGVINEHGKFDTTCYNSQTLQDCAFPEGLAWDMTTGMTIRGIWGWPMLHGETLLCNDIQAHPDGVGFPKGHVPLRCFLRVPLKHEGEVVGMVAVANKPGGYKQEDRDTLIRLATTTSVSRQHRLALAERRQAGEALRESEERFRGLYMNAPNAYFSVSATDGSIIMCNTAALHLLGYEREALEGKRLVDLYEDTLGGKGKAREIFRRFRAGESVRDVELQMKHRDGHPIWVSLSVEPVRDDHGTVVESRSMATDISERKSLETQLRRAQKMEAIGTLAGGIAHDFNNILSAIIGYSELAKMKAPEDSEVMTDLDGVLNAGNRAKALVQQILTMSRTHKLEMQPLQLRYVVKDVVSLLKATLPTTIEIRENLTKDTGVVDANPTQMHQVIMNLGTNAGQAMEKEGGLLTIGLDNVELDDVGAAQYLDMDPGLYLRLSISDTGHGMTPEIIEQIYDPYFTTKEIGEGTGLGLSVAHGIVKSHGGTIRVYSQPGEGSTFHVHLPVIKKPEKPQKEAEGPVPTGNERVLFIDDERTIADIGNQMLEGLGYDVVSTTSSIEALALFRAEPDRFDLVITDMTMSHMTGDKLAQELIKIRSDIPVILCTGFNKHISEEKAKGMGIRAFVMKPVSKRDMAETVRKVLDEK